MNSNLPGNRAESGQPKKSVTMPFGKYKGLDISDLPSRYLDWLDENLGLCHPIREAAIAELVARGELTITVVSDEEWRRMNTPEVPPCH
jgi:hypothetical protein